MLKSAFRRVLNRHVMQAHGPKKKEGTLVMWTSPTRRGCMCSFQQERRETLQSCCSTANILQTSASCGGGRAGEESLHPATPPQTPQMLVLGKRTCYLFSHLLPVTSKRLTFLECNRWAPSRATPSVMKVANC